MAMYCFHLPPQVLHYLETLSPPALFSQLLAAAIAEALSLLGSSRGAALPAAAAVVDRWAGGKGAEPLCYTHSD
jgi:hypothetical protein